MKVMSDYFPDKPFQGKIWKFWFFTESGYNYNNMKSFHYSLNNDNQGKIAKNSLPQF